MSVPWSREETLTAARERLLRAGGVTDGFGPLDVQIADDFLAVRFRWWQDPNRFVVRLRLPDTAESPWTGCPVDSAEEWAADLAGALMEELDTGFVRRARRTPQGDEVELAWEEDRELPDILGYYISGVPFEFGPDPGRHLASAGFDISLPRRAIEEGRLISWLEAYVDNAQGRPYVGQAVVVGDRVSADAAVLDVLETVAGIPEDVSSILALNAVHGAAEAGYLVVTTRLADPVLTALGFISHEPGQLALSTVQEWT
jgi:hypothetical protein